MDTKAADNGNAQATTKDGSGRSNSVERNKFPDFCKLERVQDILDRNKCVMIGVKGLTKGLHHIEQPKGFPVCLLEHVCILITRCLLYTTDLAGDCYTMSNQIMTRIRQRH